MDLSSFHVKPHKQAFRIRVDGENVVRDVEFDAIDFLARLGRATKGEKSTAERTHLFRVQLVGTTSLTKKVAPGLLFAIEPKLFKLANRTDFTTTIVAMLRKYATPLQHEAASIRCEAIRSGEFSGFTHHKILLDYMNINSPYRGLLLYHGLGSGKTCASIGIAEGFLKAVAKVFVMTPASLESNYRKDFAKCSKTYTKLRHWVREGKTWTVEDAAPNYTSLTDEDKRSVDSYIAREIEVKFRFVHYNGLTQSNLAKKLPGSGNPFDHTVVIVDEAHRFVSTIANALTKVGEDRVNVKLYKWLQEAVDCRIVFLSGTPINNRPHELGILFNMLRGSTTAWTMRGKESYLPAAVRPTLNYVDDGPPLVLTRTPDPFISEYETRTVDGEAKPVRIGVIRSDQPRMSDAEFTAALKTVYGQVDVSTHKALPDTKADFEALSEDTFKRRILGLVSYFPDLTNAMPQLNKPDVQLIPMSKTQLAIYASIRKTETETRGSYLPASRAACNFVFPHEIERPKSTRPETDDLDEVVDVAYETALAKAIARLKEAAIFSDGLATYSPKFVRLLQMIKSIDDLQLIYSSFLNNEGLMLFAAVLDAHGYEELKLKKQGTNWAVVDEHRAKKKYIMYTGKLDDETREVLRNIFNQDWSGVPMDAPTIERVKKMHVQLFLVTSAGAEGISLMDVKHVHLMEPFWTPQRFEQVIGRARRICSHRDGVTGGVTPHIYIMTGKTQSEDQTTDQKIYAAANEKMQLNAKWLQYVRDTAIECNLHGMNCYRTNQVNEYVSAPSLDQEAALSKRLQLNTAATPFKAFTFNGMRLFYSELHPKDRAGRVYYPLFEYALSKYSVGYVSFDDGTEFFTHELEPAPKLLSRKKKGISLPSLKKSIDIYLGPKDADNFMAIYETETSEKVMGFKQDSKFYTAARATVLPQVLFKTWLNK